MSKVKGARERAQVLPIDLDLVAFDISFLLAACLDESNTASQALYSYP
jgi:hypothetical protein